MPMLTRLIRIACAKPAWLVALVCATAAAAAVAQIDAGPSGAASPRVARNAGAGAHLVDARGRWLFLRGVAVTGLIQYAPDYNENPPLAAGDFKEIAALGFDYIRLPVSWSRIEPAPGRFSKPYLDRIARAVWWARAAGLYVVVDLHTDRYNRGLAPGDEADGAPDWATLTRGATGAAAIPAAWAAFWSDRRVDGSGLELHYIESLLAVSRRLRSARNLLGLELMNNPSPGTVASPIFERSQLWPFWQRAIAALRADGEQRPLWLDANSQSERLGLDPARPRRFSNDRQLVYAPHDYAGVFASPPWPVDGQPPLITWFERVITRARRLAMAPIVGEWGTGTGLDSDLWIQDQLLLQDQFRIGSAFWMWKQRPGFYNWPVVNADGSLRSDSVRAQELSEPHPDAIPGVLDAVSYLPGASLTVRVHGPGGVALLWSGTFVAHGGPSAIGAPLTRVTIDGHRAKTKLTLRQFTTASVDLGGYVVSIDVPAGRHTLTLS